jgi:drug/metabolite transporter (DMT)-like permease
LSTTPNTAHNAPQGWLAEFVLLAAIWGASFLLMRIAALEFGSFMTAFLRVALAGLFLWPVMLLRGLFPVLRANLKHIFVVGVFNSGIPFALYTYAVLHISTGLSAVLNATVPLFGAVVAWLWLGDRPNRDRMAGLAIGFAGVALLVGLRPASSSESSLWAVLACLGATTCYAVAASYTRKHLTGVHPLATATGSMLGASLVLLVPAAVHLPAQMPGLHAWAALVGVALFCTSAAYVLFFRLIERTGPARTLSVTFLIPVFGVVYGMVLLGETVTAAMLGCAVIIFAGTALSAGLIRLPAANKPATPQP